jgi:hypothetical protein
MMSGLAWSVLILQRRLTTAFLDKRQIHQVPAKVLVSNDTLKDGALVLSRKSVERCPKNFCCYFRFGHIYLLLLMKAI